MTSRESLLAEQRLLAQARVGDRAAWGEIFDRSFAKLYRFFRATVDTADTAEELAVATLLAAHRAIRTIGAAQQPLTVWIFMLARDVLAQYSPQDVERIGGGSEGHVRPQFLTLPAREILGRLPHPQRTAVELRYFVNLSVEEGAAAMGTSAGDFQALLDGAGRAMHSEARRRTEPLPGPGTSCSLPNR